MPNVTTANQTITPPQHHYIRTLVSSFFGFLAIALIISSILLVWLNHTLTDTTQYIHVVGPLASNSDVQNFIATEAADAILHGSDVPAQGLGAQLIGADKIAGMTNDQLVTELRPLVEDEVHTAIASPAFASLWQTSNQDIHRQLIAQLNSNSSAVTLNFHTLIVGTIDQLKATKLNVLGSNVTIPENAGVVTLQGDRLQSIRNAYNLLNTLMFAVIAGMIVSLALCVLISVHHLKTIRRIALSTGIFTALLALALSATSFVKPASDAVQAKMALTLVGAITEPLRVSLIIIAAVCFALVISTKIYSVVSAKNATAPTSSKKI